MNDTGELERLVVADAETWARETARELREDHRAAAGGWPRTLSEARVRVFEVVTARGPVPSLEVQERLARASYAAARRAWANLAEAETDT